MKITVICGTEKQGVTWKLKELFLERFRGLAEVTEFSLPGDCVGFCSGCMQCIRRGESHCPEASQVAAIDRALAQADLIVLATPVYVYHVTGAMKNLLDHLAYRWMLHRPWPNAFGKRAVILTQCIGSGAASAAKDLRDSLRWWGISEIGTFRERLGGEAQWNMLSPEIRRRMTGKIQRLADRFAAMDYSRPARAGLVARGRFYVCRHIEKAIYARDPLSLDGRYWKNHGWLESVRPWQ